MPSDFIICRQGCKVSKDLAISIKSLQIVDTNSREKCWVCAYEWGGGGSKDLYPTRSLIMAPLTMVCGLWTILTSIFDEPCFLSTQINLWKWDYTGNISNEWIAEKILKTINNCPCRIQRFERKYGCLWGYQSVYYPFLMTDISDALWAVNDKRTNYEVGQRSLLAIKYM